MSIGPNDPRKVGGRYWSGYWGEEYEVIAEPVFDDWRGRSITVRWQAKPCPQHPAGHSVTTTHGTAWEPRLGDRIIAEPA